jgi:type VI secretion system protein ImpB
MAGPGKIKTRNRTKARVQITYMNPRESDKQIEIPFVMGVMADLSGNASPQPKPAVSQRDFVPVDIDNFDKFMEKTRPGIRMRVKNTLDPNSSEPGEGSQLVTELQFKSMADFEPAEIVRQVPALATLLAAREQLENLRTYMRGDAEDQLQKLLKDTSMMRALSGKSEAEG